MFRSGLHVGQFIASIGCGLVAGVPSADAVDWPSEVIAKYDISFAGFTIGTFDFQSRVRSRQYALSGEARVSALFGAFKWRGLTRSSGRALANQPAPKSYAFDYNSNAKVGSVRMAFQKGQIIKSDVVPYKPYSARHVPLRSEHLRNVYDPISAIMAITRTTIGHPCKRRIPVFDGKQRFDLVLSPHSRQQIHELRPSGQPGLAYVCQVKYVPLGGYKQNRQTRYMANNRGMRVVLREVPLAKLFVPYEVRVPTIAGEAVLTSRQVHIVTARHQRIALVH